jgi:hypothetical protein
MNMKLLTACIAAVLPLAPLSANADQASTNAQIQTAIHQQMVRNGIQQSLQNQLQQQQSALETQQHLIQLQTQNNINQSFLTLQQIQIQQQLLLIQAELRALKASKKHNSKPSHP